MRPISGKEDLQKTKMKNRGFYLIRVKSGIWGLLFFSVVFIENPSIISAQQHGDLVRMPGETKIYLIQSGQRRAIASEEVFRQMGFKMEDVKELDP